MLLVDKDRISVFFFFFARKGARGGSNQFSPSWKRTDGHSLGLASARRHGAAGVCRGKVRRRMKESEKSRFLMPTMELSLKLYRPLRDAFFFFLPSRCKQEKAKTLCRWIIYCLHSRNLLFSGDDDCRRRRRRRHCSTSSLFASNKKNTQGPLPRL